MTINQNSKPHRTIPVVPDCLDILREDQSRFYDFLPIGYVTLDEKGMIKSGNLTAAEMLGVEKDLLINTDFLSFVHKEDQKNLQLDKNSLSDLTSHSFDIRLKKSQDLLWIRVYVSINENLHFYGRQIRLMLCDITGLKQAEQEKTKLERKLEQRQKVEAIGVLSSAIVHDYNNILHPIVGNLEILIEDAACDRELQAALKNVLIGTNRAGNLVKQILSFSHQADLEVGLIKIQPIIREVLKLNRSTLPANIKIIQTIDNECGPVMADSTHIYQIVMNLITNAFQAMGNDDGILDVTLKEIEITRDVPGDLALTPGTYVCLSVGDTGKGIEASIMNKIFDPHFTTKEKGTGIGLSVISHILKKYGGDICFSNESGRRTLFRVYLPRGYVPFDTTTTRANNDKQKDLYGNESILFVDDDPFIVQVQQKTFERYGYIVTPFIKSLDALNEFKTRPETFDIVICDMAMPIVAGLELAYRIKQIRPDIPVIICTGFSEQINKDNFHDMGVDGFLLKPVRKEESLKTIRYLLDNR